MKDYETPDYDDCYVFDVDCTCKVKVGVYAKSPEEAEELLKYWGIKEFDYEIEKLEIEEIGGWKIE